MNQKWNEEVKQARKTEYDINPLILNRWSPRSMSGQEMTDDELMPLFEAARWAPSSYNGQLWKFLYAKRNTENWDLFYNLMVEQNQSWAKNASVLIVLVSRKNFEFNDKPSVTHTFDAGAAWENLALEASDRGLVAHGMEGFDYDKAKTDLNVPDEYQVMCMIAIGKRAPKENLPEETQKMEAPSDRKAIKEIIKEGKF